MIHYYKVYPDNPENTKGLILFIHGAWHASWVWDNFIEYFSSKNYTCIALDLRGHGKSDTETSLRWASLSDYSKDVKSIIVELDIEPIIIAHSMGGAVMMKYLKLFDSNNIQEIILITPALRKSVWKLTFKLLFKQPWPLLKTIFTIDLGKMVENREVVDELLFHEDTSDEVKSMVFHKLQGESFRAYIDMLFNSSVSSDNAPMTIISAQNDYLFKTDDYEKMAHNLNIDHISVAAVAHDLMVDTNWEKVANIINNIISEGK